MWISMKINWQDDLVSMSDQHGTKRLFKLLCCGKSQATGLTILPERSDTRRGERLIGCGPNGVARRPPLTFQLPGLLVGGGDRDA